MSNEIRVLFGIGLMADTVAENCKGVRVWLKEVFIGGRQIGVGECWPDSNPCEWHLAVSKADGLVVRQATRFTSSC